MFQSSGQQGSASSCSFILTRLQNKLGGGLYLEMKELVLDERF